MGLGKKLLSLEITPITLLAAKSFTFYSRLIDISLICIKEKNGPGIELWGIPGLIVIHSDSWLFRTNLCCLSNKKIWSNLGHCLNSHVLSQKDVLYAIRDQMIGLSKLFSVRYWKIKLNMIFSKKECLS